MFQDVLLDKTKRRKTSILLYGKGQPIKLSTAGDHPEKVLTMSQVEEWKARLSVLHG